MKTNKDMATRLRIGLTDKSLTYLEVINEVTGKSFSAAINELLESAYDAHCGQGDKHEDIQQR